MRKLFGDPWYAAPAGALGGALYGLVSYFIFRNLLNDLLSVAFILLVPMSMGVIAALLTPRGQTRRSFANASLAIVIVMLVTMVFNYESFFCWLILLPLAILAAAIGVVFVLIFKHSRGSNVSILYSLMVVPFLALPLELSLPDSTSYQTSHNSIVIGAPTETVWNAIKSVPTIREHEYRRSWTHRLGLPRPLAATLDHEGVGGVREASFSSGLSFLEEITLWQPEQDLAFRIVAQGEGDARRAFALGPEIGGKFVDVVSGRYSLEPLPDGTTLLHLYSTQRMTSKFNLYAGLWINAVMRDLQGTILEVIKARCETDV